MRTVLAAFLALTAVAPALAADKYVQARVSRWSPTSYNVYEPFLNVDLSLHGFGSGLSFSGRPFSGSVSGAGSFFNLSGSGISGSVNAWAGGWRVNAIIHPADPRQPPRRFDFMMQAQGRTDDPRHPPSYSVWENGSSLNIRPGFDGREYTVSGWIDETRFGPEGTALVGIMTALAMRSREQQAEAYRPLPAPPRPKAAVERLRLPVLKLPAAGAVRWH